MARGRDRVSRGEKEKEKVEGVHVYAERGAEINIHSADSEKEEEEEEEWSEHKEVRDLCVVSRFVCISEYTLYSPLNCQCICVYLWIYIVFTTELSVDLCAFLDIHCIHH